MRSVSYTINGGSATSPVYNADNKISPNNYGIAVVVGGTITFKVQYTFDDVQAVGYNPASGNWFDHPTLVGSASINSNIAYPVNGIRIISTAGTGSATLTIIQAGGGGLA